MKSKKFKFTVEIEARRTGYNIQYERVDYLRELESLVSVNTMGFVKKVKVR
jgi:hypothetical protein